VGAVTGWWLILLPGLSRVNDHRLRIECLVRALKLYNPLHIGALGIVLFTGAFQLTELKSAYRQSFVQQFGYALALKLIFVFVLVILSVYQSLGLGHRLVRRQESGVAVSPEELTSVVRRLKVASACIVFLAAVTVWLGFRLVVQPSVPEFLNG
jgi:hypothetical protein